MTTDTPLITRIAAVIQKEYGLGPDSAPSIVRRVLEMAAAESPADQHREDCNACYEAAMQDIHRMEP